MRAKNNSVFSGSLIQPVRERERVEEVKKMQKLLSRSGMPMTDVWKAEKCWQLEKCNINRQLIPLVLIAEDKCI